MRGFLEQAFSSGSDAPDCDWAEHHKPSNNSNFGGDIRAWHPKDAIIDIEEQVHQAEKALKASVRYLSEVSEL